MEDPFQPDYPQGVLNRVGPRNLLHCLASNVDDPTVEPRWGRIGKQKIVDERPLPPHPIQGIKYNMETIDEVIRDKSLEFIERAVRADKPFFAYVNPSRMHVITHLSDKYQQMRTPENGWTIYEAGMAEVDDNVGVIMERLRALGVDDNTIVIFTTDNGAENFTWPDGGQTPFAGAKGTVLEGGFRVPCIVRWPGRVPANKVENGLISGLDWFPTLMAAAGDPNVVEELKRGKQLGDRTFKVHLDGYNQIDLITGKGPSRRREIVYFAESTFGAIRFGDYKYRFIDQPQGWMGGTVRVDMPILVNLRLDPFERTSRMDQSTDAYSWGVYEIWRFVFVQQVVAELAQSVLDFPPMQRSASFNLEAIKADIIQKIESQRAVR